MSLVERAARRALVKLRHSERDVVDFYERARELYLGATYSTAEAHTWALRITADFINDRCAMTVTPAMVAVMLADLGVERGDS